MAISATVSLAIGVTARSIRPRSRSVGIGTGRRRIAGRVIPRVGSRKMIRSCLSARNRLRRAGSRLRAVTPGRSSRAPWTSSRVISRRLVMRSAPGGQHRVEAVEVAADRRERQFPVRAAAFAAHHLHPLEELAADALGEGLDALLDGALDGGALPGGVGDDHAALAEELQDSPDGGAGAVAECPDVGFGDGGVRLLSRPAGSAGSWFRCCVRPCSSRGAGPAGRAPRPWPRRPA